MGVEVLERAAGAERRHADESTVRADDLVPALTDRGLDRDAHRRRADDALPLGGAAGAEEPEAGHRYHPRRDPALAQELLRRDRYADLRSGGVQRHLSLARRRR